MPAPTTSTPCPNCYSPVNVQAGKSADCPKCGIIVIGEAVGNKGWFYYWLVLLILGLPAVLVGLCAVGVTVYLATSNGAIVNQRTMTREEFRSAIYGKTPEEVLKSVGKPDSTSETGSGGPVYWHYRNRTYDPVTGKIDHSAQVVFKNGRVVAVNY